jgi:hypothetical protein
VAGPRLPGSRTRISYMRLDCAELAHANSPQRRVSAYFERTHMPHLAFCPPAKMAAAVVTAGDAVGGPMTRTLLAAQTGADTCQPGGVQRGCISCASGCSFPVEDLLRPGEMGRQVSGQLRGRACNQCPSCAARRALTERG